VVVAKEPRFLLLLLIVRRLLLGRGRRRRCRRASSREAERTEAGLLAGLALLALGLLALLGWQGSLGDEPLELSPLLVGLVRNRRLEDGADRDDGLRNDRRGLERRPVSGQRRSVLNDNAKPHLCPKSEHLVRNAILLLEDAVEDVRQDLDDLELG
jgi:hypothetical protein